MMRRLSPLVGPQYIVGTRMLSTPSIEYSSKLSQLPEFDSAARSLIEKTVKKFQGQQRDLVARRSTAEYIHSYNPLIRSLETVSGEKRSFDPKACPESLLNRKVELTGPASDVTMVINGLNSRSKGVCCFMGDAEDASTMSDANTVNTIRHNYHIARRSLTAEKNGKQYKLNKDIATYIFRPPGLHLPVPSARIGTEPVPGFLFHLAAYTATNGNELLKQGQGPYIYLPKLEGQQEAEYVNEVLNFVEAELGWAKGTIKSTVLVETWPTLVELPRVVEALMKDQHLVGINAARWDYLASIHKHFARGAVFPPRSELTMLQPFMKEYVTRIVSTAHHYGIHAIGGMSAFIPVKDAAQNQRAMENAKADKQREFDAGLDGCWIAHPDMAPIREIFDAIPEPHQINSPKSLDIPQTIQSVTPTFGKVKLTVDDIKTNVKIGIEYLAAWISGTGAVALNGLMEDAATMELSRYNLWNHRHFALRVTDNKGGSVAVTPQLIKTIVTETLVGLKSGGTQVPYATQYFDDAATIFTASVLSDTPPTFLTLPALNLVARHDGNNVNVDILCPSKIANYVFPKEKVAPFAAFSRRGVRLASYRGEELTRLIQERKAPVVFFGAYTGPVAQQYAAFGVHLYGGGWQNNAANNAQRTPYPDTLFVTPGDLNNTADMFNNYMEAAKINQELTISEAKPEKRAAIKEIDYEAISVMLDGENGFGSEDKIIEMVRNLVKRGVNLIHIEDQIEKRCGHIGGKSVHKTETVRRMYEAARWVLNEFETKEGLKVIGNVRLVARTDCLDAKFFDGTANFPSFNTEDLLNSFVLEGVDPSSGRSIIDNMIRNEYLRPNKSTARFTSKFATDSFLKRIDLGHYNTLRTQVLKSIESSQRFVPLDYKFVDWDKGHTPDGRFWYLRDNCGMQMSIHRMINVMDLADIGWMETKDPVVSELAEFVDGVRNHKNEFGQRPFKDFIVLYNLSPSFNWEYNFGKQATPLARAILKDFSSDAAKLSALTPEQGAEWVKERIAAFGDTHDFTTKSRLELFSALQSTTVPGNVRSETLKSLTDNVSSFVKEGKLSLDDSRALTGALEKLTNEQANAHKLQKLIANEHMRQFSNQIFKAGAALQLITLPEFHFDMLMAARLAHSFVKDSQGMLAYSQLVQEPEFEMRDKHGYDGVTHQRKAMLDYWQEVLRLLNPERPDLVSKAGSSHTEGQMTQDWRMQH